MSFDSRIYQREWGRKKRNTNYPEIYLRKLFADRRYRARKRGVKFTITVKDLVLPTHCPVLGIQLSRSTGKRGGPGDCSPTIDRINPRLGYVKGNVIVVSNRANRIKNNSTPEELRKVAAFYERLL